MLRRRRGGSQPILTYGIKEMKRNETQAGPSKRQLKCSKLRDDINLLKKAVEEAQMKKKKPLKNRKARS